MTRLLRSEQNKFTFIIPKLKIRLRDCFYPISNKKQNFRKNNTKVLTKQFLCAKIIKRTKIDLNFPYLAELCKGSTADSDSVCLGSNPSSAAIGKGTPKGVLFSLPMAAELVRSHSVPERKRRIGFAYPERRSASSLVSRSERVSSPEANTLVPLPKSVKLLSKLVAFTFSLFTKNLLSFFGK